MLTTVHCLLIAARIEYHFPFIRDSCISSLYNKFCPSGRVVKAMPCYFLRKAIRHWVLPAQVRILSVTHFFFNFFSYFLELLKQFPCSKMHNGLQTHELICTYVYINFLLYTMGQEPLGYTFPLLP